MIYEINLIHPSYVSLNVGMNNCIPMFSFSYASFIHSTENLIELFAIID